MGKLIFKYATMNSGKTLDLIIRAYNYNETNQKVIIMKPKIDDKGDKKIVSRTGLEQDVDFLINKDDSIIDILAHKLKDIRIILVDESQFLNKEQIDELFALTKSLNIDVVCYGLRNNFKMEAFEGSRRLLEIADELDQFTSLCVCGNIASYVGRKYKGVFQTDGEVVVIDKLENQKNYEYIPLCGECYLSKVKKIDLQKIKKKVI